MAKASKPARGQSSGRKNGKGKRKRRNPKTEQSRCISKVLRKLHQSKVLLSSKAKGTIITYISGYFQKGNVARPGQVPIPKMKPLLKTPVGGGSGKGHSGRGHRSRTLH